MKYLFILFTLFCLSDLSAQIYYECIPTDGCSERTLIYHSNDYSHFSINDKIYHLISFQNFGAVLKIKVRNGNDEKLIYITSQTIELKTIEYKLIAEYRVNKLI